MAILIRVSDEIEIITLLTHVGSQIHLTSAVIFTLPSSSMCQLRMAAKSLGNIWKKQKFES
ncbi:CLUMA_CG014659, isoform A [Clunio marinus]|uniref:CLUMA_CG014659, isoform A n=1 Tax=Clunio marinus TaxID=568069 RepID=A0A1J1IMZ7_9DIPT|nr:CLUMA_CG014659, isoform A [Clunio marinus]